MIKNENTIIRDKNLEKKQFLFSVAIPFVKNLFSISTFTLHFLLKTTKYFKTILRNYLKTYKKILKRANVLKIFKIDVKPL